MGSELGGAARWKRICSEGLLSPDAIATAKIKNNVLKLRKIASSPIG